MKKHSIKNRIYIAIAFAVFLQSVVFGIAFLSTGIYGMITEEPYRILYSQTEEKNRSVSMHMNNVLAEGDSLSKLIRKLGSEKAVHDKLLESLGRQESVSGIFYMDIGKRTGVFYHDSEPSVYTAGYGDITCRIGRVESSYKIALDNEWTPRLKEEAWNLLEERADDTEGGTWCIYQDGLYYVVPIRDQGGKRFVGFELERGVMEAMLTLDRPPYEGMRSVLMQAGAVLYHGGTQCGQIEEGQEEGYFKVRMDGEEYVGIRSQLQSYGKMEMGEHLYIGVMCKESAISALGMQVIKRVLISYAVSILISASAAYLALGLVIQPLNRLHDEITRQNVRNIYFEPTGVQEIDTIYEALNTMTTRLERSYARYAFAMEAAEENLGSFEYQYGGENVTLSSSVRHILNIPQDMYIEENRITISGWALLSSRLSPVDGLDGYVYRGQDKSDRFVDIKTKEESGGVFGVIIDKTDEYKKISSLQYLTQHDHLTDLYNGAYFREEGQRLLDSTGWKRAKQTVHAAVFCDLDNLKTVNDNYGHDGGDKYLCAMADWLRSIIKREDAIAARMSGDEFAILFYGYDSRQDILSHLEQGYERRPEVELPKGGKVRLSASIGVAFRVGKGGSMEQLIKEADEAMYQRKRGGKDGIHIYGQEV